MSERIGFPKLPISEMSGTFTFLFAFCTFLEDTLYYWNIITTPTVL